ncbi:substrate-binding periplasmic protein [Solimicrobium silvestre]|uniref:substrate-binding periplasmic protein n=1 Tax=Solimicrobium silvestre TaxID=2099400 RepID=UPI001FB00E93|nr:transporter substrate-binding domain-containing protein [Solimicrobium silvestre]
MSSRHSTTNRIAFLLIFFVVSLQFVSDANAQQWLKITLTEQEYPPLIIHGNGTEGVLTEIVRESFKLAKVEAVFTSVPNNRAITGLMQGLYEGSYGWAHSRERDAKLIYSSKPIYFLRIVFFQRSGEGLEWNSLTDLAQYTIGVTMGNYYSDEFESLSASGALHTDPAPSDISNFKKLLIGRIHLFPIDQDVGLFLLKNNFSQEERKKITFQRKAISIIPVYLVVRRNLPQAQELRDRFDQGYQQLADSGQLEKILALHKSQLLLQQ